MAIAFKIPRLMSPFYVFIIICTLIPIAYSAGDYWFTWHEKITSNYFYGERDYYVIGACIAPSVLGHIATIWGHYFRAEREFQHSIAKVTTPASVNQKISLWERHIWWGYTVKYWIMVAFTVLLNVAWFVTPMVTGTARMIERFGYLAGIARKLPVCLLLTVCFFCSGRPRITIHFDVRSCRV